MVIIFNSEVHKIAILDMRIVNMDRHAANILVQNIKGVSPKSIRRRLIPIDHGMSISSTLDMFE